MATAEALDSDEFEYLIDGLSSGNKQIRKKSALDLIDLCCNQVKVQAVVALEAQEQTLTGVYDAIQQLISIKKKATPSDQHIRFYCLVTLTVLSKSPFVRSSAKLPTKLVHALLDLLGAPKKSCLAAEEVGLCIAPIRHHVENLFSDDEESSFGNSFDKAAWIAKIGESDLCLLTLINFLTPSDLLGDKDSRVMSLQATAAAGNGQRLSLVVEMISDELFEWMSAQSSKEASVLTLWRLSNMFQLCSKLISHCEKNKRLLGQTASTNDSFKEMFNVIKWCDDRLVSNPTHHSSATVTHCLLTASRCLVDLTDHCKPMFDVVGSYELELVLDMLMSHSQVKQSKDGGWVFDFVLLLLSLLSNCIEDSNTNRQQFAKLKGQKACNFIVDVFVQTLPEDVVVALKSKNQTEEVEFGWDAEQLVTSAYASLLLGCLMRNSEKNRLRILKHIPGHSPVILIHVLRGFVGFQKDAGVLTNEVLQATNAIISELERLLTKKPAPKSSSPSTPKVEPDKGVDKPQPVKRPSPAKSPKSAKKSRKRRLICIDDIVS